MLFEIKKLKFHTKLFVKAPEKLDQRHLEDET